MDHAHERLDRDCSVFRTVEAVGDAWSWLVLREAIFDQVQRFDDFHTRLGIARSTLSARLDQLVTAGLLERRPQRLAGSAFDYALTQRGEDFFGCLMTAMRWGDRWCSTGGPPPVQATHLGCGRPMDAVLSCSGCDRPILARDVSFDRRPAPVTRPAGPTRRQRIPGLDLLERHRPCSIARTLQVIGDRWSALVIQECFFGTRRFDDFQRQLAIAPNILSQRLGRLTDLGVLVKVPYRRQPLRHHYRLTGKGLDLYPVPLAMLTWGDRWLSGGKPPVGLTHRLCGQRFTALLGCSACGDRLERPDVMLTPTEAGQPVPAPAGQRR